MATQNPPVPRPGGNASQLNLSAVTVIKASPGTLYTVNVITAGSTTGKINDCKTTGAIAASNQSVTIPLAVGSYPFTFPHFSGMVFTPGTGMVASISYS